MRGGGERGSYEGTNALGTELSGSANVRAGSQIAEGFGSRKIMAVVTGGLVSRSHAMEH
jgi:hypothetical protein